MIDLFTKFQSAIFLTSIYQMKKKLWSQTIIWLSILGPMDNKHYFGLYLIRIKHSLVLFSLLLTAFQSLAYLLLAILFGKVKRQSFFFNETYWYFFFRLSQFILESIGSICTWNYSFFVYFTSFSNTVHITSTWKISSCSYVYIMFIYMGLVNIVFYNTYTFTSVYINYSFNGYCYIFYYNHTYYITHLTIVDNFDGFNNIINSFNTCYSVTSFSWYKY